MRNPVGAVDDASDVHPLSRRDEAACRLHALNATAVGSSNIDGSVGVQPQAVYASNSLASGVGALVKDCRPPRGHGIDLDPPLTRPAVIEIERRTVGYRNGGGSR